MDLETEERIASLEAQVQQLLMMQMMASGEDNGMLGEVVEPLPIASGGGGNKKPFDYVTEKKTEGGVEKTIYKLIDCIFYERGSLITLENYTFTDKPNGSVYLRGVRETDNDIIEWDIGTTEKSKPAEGKVWNIRLYDFSNGSIFRDYRDTFLNITPEVYWE